MHVIRIALLVVAIWALVAPVLGEMQRQVHDANCQNAWQGVCRGGCACLRLQKWEQKGVSSTTTRLSRSRFRGQLERKLERTYVARAVATAPLRQEKEVERMHVARAAKDAL